MELTPGPTSCKCQLVSLTQREIPPGGRAQVVVQWNTGEEWDYAHSAQVVTNDPLRRIVRFSIQGKVMALLRCEPETLVFSRVNPGETPTATAFVYSQSWDEVDFTQITSSREGITWSIEPASDEETAAVYARSAYRLTVTLPNDLPESYFSESIALQGRPIGGADADQATYQLGVEGVVLRRLCLYGPAIDARGMLLLGRVVQGQEKQVQVLMKLRDDQRELPLQAIQCTPDFLRVRVEPYHGQNRDNLGLYRLHVEIPADAPTFRLPPFEHGAIRLTFDHPRVPALELPVDLIVMPREEKSW